MQRAFFIEEGSSNDTIDDSEVTAKYSGKYSEYEIKPSKNMPGFYLIKDLIKNRDSSDLINSKIKKIIFSDCVKTFDEMINGLQNSTKIEENLVDGLKNIIYKKPRSSVFSIDENLSDEHNEKSFQIEENSELKNNIATKENQQVEKNFKQDNLKNEVIQDNIVILSNQEITLENMQDDDLNKDYELINLDDLNFPQDDKEIRSTNNIQELYDEYIELENLVYGDNELINAFGKRIKFDSNMINSIVISVNGYDEKNDKMIFDVSKFPTRVDYRYAISKDTLEIKILGFLNLLDARILMDTYSYSFISHGGKNIKVSINDVLVYEENF